MKIGLSLRMKQFTLIENTHQNLRKKSQNGLIQVLIIQNHQKKLR